MDQSAKIGQANQGARFQEFECVVVKKNPQNSKLVQADPEWLTLKKGDKGAIVMVYGGRDGFSYELDVPKRGITVNIEEKYLKADRHLAPPKPQAEHAIISTQPPKMPEGLD